MHSLCQCPLHSLLMLTLTVKSNHMFSTCLKEPSQQVARIPCFHSLSILLMCRPCEELSTKHRRLLPRRTMHTSCSSLKTLQMLTFTAAQQGRRSGVTPLDRYALQPTVGYMCTFTCLLHTRNFLSTSLFWYAHSRHTACCLRQSTVKLLDISSVQDQEFCQ